MSYYELVRPRPRKRQLNTKEKLTAIFDRSIYRGAYDAKAELLEEIPEEPINDAF
jgi:hypothetical protein